VLNAVCHRCITLETRVSSPFSPHGFLYRTVDLVGYVFLQILRFSTVIIILSVLRTRLHFRLILATVRHSFEELTMNVM